MQRQGAQLWHLMPFVGERWALMSHPRHFQDGTFVAARESLRHESDEENAD